MQKLNLLVGVIELIFIFTMVIILKKKMGKQGLLIWVAIASILANIQVTKSITVLGLNITLGNILFDSIFLCLDILCECYGEKEAITGVKVGAISIIIYLVISQFTITFIPNKIDIASTSMNTIFTLSPRICIASLLMFILSNILSIKIYDKLKKVFEGKKLWLRNNIATVLSNCVENYMFTFLAFYGIYNIKDIVIIATSTTIIEIIIAILDTPFLYIAKNK